MSSGRRRIGLIVDHPQRDLPGAVLTARALAARGVESALVPLYQQVLDVPLLGLSGLVLNYARLNNRDLIEAYKSLGLPLFVVDTEGGILSDSGARSPAGLARIMRESGLQDLLDGYCFWGPALERAYAEAGVMGAATRRVTGCPRFDLCAPRWQPILAAPDAGYVLVNTNFSGINPRFSRSPEAELQAFKSVGISEDYALRLVAELKTAFDGYLDTVEDLARRRPERRIRVRPHPFESPDTYRRRFAGLANLEVEPGGDVFQVIHNAACVLHLNCGTAVEATMLGRLPIQMEHLNTPFLSAHAPLPGRISHRPESLEELAETLEDVEGATAAFDFQGRKAEFLEPFFGPLDGQAADRVADALADWTDGGAPAPRSLGAALRGTVLKPSSGQRAQAALALLAGSRAATALRARRSPARRGKRFDAQTVREWLEAFDRCAERPLGLQVRGLRNPLTGLPLESLLVSPA
jgi:surface carbohydrate biosynthesis protein